MNTYTLPLSLHMLVEKHNTESTATYVTSYILLANSVLLVTVSGTPTEVHVQTLLYVLICTRKVHGS